MEGRALVATNSSLITNTKQPCLSLTNYMRFKQGTICSAMKVYKYIMDLKATTKRPILCQVNIAFFEGFEFVCLTERIC